MQLTAFFSYHIFIYFISYLFYSYINNTTPKNFFHYANTLIRRLKLIKFKTDKGSKTKLQLKTTLKAKLKYQ